MSEHVIRFRLNGQDVTMAVTGDTTLLSLLREQLNLTGTKDGCAEGDCGACTVILDGEAVKSCLVLAVQVDGSEVTTVEGLARDGVLHRLQQSFIEEGAIQCGYCTPGMLLAAKALLDRVASPTEEEIRRTIAGNLCRCTGYLRIIRAIQAAAQ